MKIRKGFVSNSSSSSFIIRKSALTPEQHKEVADLLYSRNNNYETNIVETDHFFKGEVEAHNALGQDSDPLAELLDLLVCEKFKLTEKDFVMRYEDFVDEGDLKDEN